MKALVTKQSKKWLALLFLFILCAALTACLPENDDGAAVTTACQHTQSEWKIEQNATCTETGTKAEVCVFCSETLSTETIASLGHDIINHDAIAATCTEKGCEAYEACSRCDYSTYKEIAALGHDSVNHNAIAATCTEKGCEAYETCSRCDYSTYKETAALGHDIKQYSAKAATCTEKGCEAYEACSRCSYTTYKEIAALGHDAVNHDGLAATCTTKGYAAYVTCNRCSYTTYKETAALGHNIKQYKSKAATCTAKGYEAYEACSRCSYTTYKETAALGHNIKQYDAKAATCTAKGYAAYEACSRCSYTTYKEIAALGHKYVKGVCSVCKANDPTYVPPLEEIVVKPNTSSTISIDKIKQSSTTIAPAEILTYKGNITQKGQVDVYTYTVLRDGRLRIELSEIYAGNNVDLYVLNSLGETVSYKYNCSNGSGITLENLEAGKTYTIKVCQYSGYSNYTMSVGKQKPTVDVTSLVKISDSIQFKGQRNVYNFVADVAGNHTLTISGMDGSNVVELYVLNELGEKVAYDSYCSNKDKLVLKNLAIGTKYTICIYQKTGTGNYTLTIE